MPSPIERVAYWWGKQIAAYGTHIANTGDVHWHGAEGLPQEPVIWFAWHGGNLVSLALHHKISSRECQAFIPPGIVGTAMRGWLDGVHFEAALLPKDGTGNPSGAMKAILRGLSKDRDLVIAVDGPYGPAGRVRPGAFWLARMTGRPLVPIGVAAKPAVRFPRWDRHLIPLPRARLAVACGKPLYLQRDHEIDDAFLDSMKHELNSISQLARDIVLNKGERT